MSDDDLLAEATRALRDEPTRGADPEATRARVLASVYGERRRRVSRIVWALPVAAVLAGTSAWATVTGRLPEAWQAVSTWLATTSEVAAPKAPTTAPGARVAGGVGQSPSPAPQGPGPGADDSAAEGVGGAPAVSTGHTGSAGSAGGSSPTASAAASAAVEAREDALYRAAHQAHFGGGEPGRALAAWDAYLAAAPRGRFALEARYNRALCLVRLGRRSEARTALVPFAAHTGGYRASEARELLEAIDGARRDAGTAP